MTNFIIIPSYNEGQNINVILKKISDCKIENLVVVIVDDSEISFKSKINTQKFKVIYLNRGKKYYNPLPDHKLSFTNFIPFISF